MNERDRCALVIVDARYEGTSVAPAGRSPIAWVWEGWPTARVVKIDERPRRSAAPIARWIIPPCDVAVTSGFGTDVPLAGQSNRSCPLDALGTAFARFDVHEAWYLPYAQNAATPAAEILELMVRSPMDPGSLGAAVRDAVASVDPELAIAQMATMERVRVETLTQERVAAQTVSLFAMLGLALAALGTYGVISYAMARRTRELAIRAAIGAAPRALIQLVMGHGLGLAAGGVVAGLALAVAFHRVVASQLSQVAAADPRIYLGVAALLLGVGAAASWLPARRAIKVDPAIALRSE